MSVKKKTQVKKRRKPTRRERWDRTPYWLWIQFLQITYSQNPNVKKKYKDWIGFETLKTKKDFELWWGLYGDELFGDTTGDSQYVAEITSKAEIKNIKNDSYMYLEIPLNRKLSTSHNQVMDLIRKRRKELGLDKIKDKPKSKYMLSTNRLRTKNLELYLKAYKLKNRTKKINYIDIAKKLEFEIEDEQDTFSVIRKVGKYLQKANKIINNVKDGRFPGEY